MAIRTDEGDAFTPLKRALDMYKQGLFDLREAAHEAGIPEYEFQEAAKTSVPATVEGFDKHDLPVFVRKP